MYTMAVLGNVWTHLTLRKLKPNNKEKNYAIYGTVFRLYFSKKENIFFLQSYFTNYIEFLLTDTNKGGYSNSKSAPRTAP